MKIRLWTDRKIMKGAEPIFLKGSKEIGVLLLHGWSSSPQEFDPDYETSLAKELNEAGYTVYVPLRVGQGTKPEDLIGLTWEDWVADALNHYDLLAEEVKSIVVGGMSTGSNLAIKVAQQRPVLGIIAMGTTVFVNHHFVFLALSKLLRRSNELKEKTYLKADKDVALRKVHYTRYPYSSLFENLRAAKATRKILPQIKRPVLIMHSSNDHVVNPKSSKYIYEHIGSENKQLAWIDDSYHSFTTDKHAGKAAEIVKTFIDRISSR